MTIAGLGTAVALFAGTAPDGWLPVAGLALVFGPVLCWAGTLVGESDRAPSPAERTDPGFAGYPILAVPVGTALAATAYRVAGEKMAATVVEQGWDGAWFRRAYDYYGNPVGSADNDEGQIFIEPQGICIIGGVGVDDGLAVKALASVRERLAGAHGIVLQHPPYADYRLELGEISSYPPGYKENSSTFCHTNPWMMIAEAIVGNGDGAFDYYKRINPSAREEISDVHRCEPYVYAQTIAGPAAPTG